jgi:hypothetical protein
MTRRLCAAAMLAVWTAPTLAAAQGAGGDKPTFTLYGTIVANGSWADTQLFVGDVPMWALPDTQRVVPESIGSLQPNAVPAGEVTDFQITARQTQLGLRVEMPAGSSSWTPSGVVEFDFFGDRPAVGHGTVFSQPRLRLAYVRLAHSSGWAVVAGQDWAVFAPQNPSSFAHMAMPLAAAAGNPWMRLPQFRVEKRTGGTGRGLLLQAAVLRPVGGGDAPVAGSLADTPSLSGERSGQPFYEARLAYVSGSQTLGVSAHFGKEKAEPETLDTTGVAVDGAVRFGKLGVSGEAWSGSNLDTFQAGILQGVSSQRGTPVAMDTMGGWVQLSAFARPGWTLNGGFGLDDPDDAALTALVTRAKNQLVWVNSQHRLHPNVVLAIEYNRFDTTFRSSPVAVERKGAGNYMNVALALTF